MQGWKATRNSEHQLLDVVRNVRRRWRMRQLLQGGAITLGIGFIVFFGATWGIDRLRFDPRAVLVFRIVLWSVAAGLLVRFVARPLWRRVSDEQVALYLEEREPSLKAAFMAATEATSRRAAGSEGASPGLDARLLRIAIERARKVELGRRAERERLRRATTWLAGVATTVLLIGLFGPAFQGTAGSLLISPWTTAGAANPYAIGVEPGDVLIARGSDQLIRAVPQGFETDEVELAVRRGDSESWERYVMMPGDGGAGFEILLFDLDDPADYAVSSEGVHSPVYRIDVADLPYVDRIDLEYRFPAYTGLAPRSVDDGGDIAVLRGTEVRLRITPTLATQGARLSFDDEGGGAGEGELVPLADGTFETTFTVTRETFYRIEFMGPGGRYVVGSPDYLIEPLDDQPPGIRISEPGRDVRLSPIEELYVEVEAEDDYGLGRVELLYSVNGGEEVSRALHGTRRGGVTQLSGGHTFFLEEFGLEPGDVLSYYARAADLGVAAPGVGAGAGAESSDIYFVEIRPFERNYRQADQGGGGGGAGGGGAGMGGELSEQQRQIVAATFRLMRDGEEFDADEMAENLATLTLLQGRLRQQVEELVEQMQQRGVASDPAFETVFRELPLAPAEMRAAETMLGERRLRDALAPEQRALQHLQRAEAAFRDVQVQQGGGGGGGGGGAGGAAAEELADLFELELDRLRNQYETVQRGQQRQQDREVDEALQKLEELARRQQQMNERAAAQPRSGAAGGQGQQQQMIEETEELARQLQRLAREDGRADVEESARRLQQAADQMRQAQASGRRGQGGAEAAAALDRLREARRLLENRQVAAVEREVRDAVSRAERIAERQRELQGDVNEDPATRDPDRLAGLRDRKAELAAEVDALETDLDRLAREARPEQPDASRRLAEAATAIRESRLRDKINFSRGALGTQTGDFVRNFEEQISRDAENVRVRVQAAADALGESDPRRLGRQLDETRDLVRGLESLQERIEQRAGDATERDGEDSAPGRQGPPGEDSGQGSEQGQSGEQDGAGQRGEGGAQGQGGQGGQQGQGGGAGQAGGAPRGGQGFAPGGGGGGGGPRLSPEDVRQFQRELRQRRDDAGRLRDDLSAEGVDVGDLDRVIAGLDRLRNMGDFDDPEELARLQADVLRGLKDFEFFLRRNLGEQIERFFLSGSDDVPEEYRELVEAYYRALSENPPPR